MSVTASMTAAPRQVVIDLTLDDSDDPEATPTPARVSGDSKRPYLNAVPEGEPPAKKRRKGSEWAQEERETAKTFVRQLLLPHVAREVDRLSPQRYAVDKIAVEAVTILLTSTSFLERVGAAHGVLTTREASEIEARAALLVRQLSALPKFQRHDKKLESSPLKSLPKPRIHPSKTGLAPPPPPPPPPSPPSPPSPPIQASWFCPVVQAGTCAKLEQVPGEPRARRRQGFRAQMDASAAANASTWLQLQRRPYLRVESRDAIARGLQGRVALQDCPPLPIAYHVDFTLSEIAEIIRRLETAASANFPRTEEALFHLVRKNDVSSLVGNTIPGRTVEDIQNFCSDVRAGHPVWRTNPLVLSLKKADPTLHHQNKNANRVSSMLLARELEGNVGFGRMRQYENFQNKFRVCHEDGLSVIAEFTNCAGDITAMCWVPNGNIICGTTAHSDAHNQQYNKPGNLLLCSTKKGTLQAMDDHRIPRPVVDDGENSTHAMRQSQDPWLYSSVVSTDYDAVTGRGYTSSFDKTVKVWDVPGEAVEASCTKTSMKAVATWHHDGNVNFVAAAKDGSGRVATAADVPTGAIRIYTVDSQDVQNSPYYTVSCTRNDAGRSDKWAYFPATMQWGLCAGTRHLLAIGYSPRGLSGDDSDIPEDKVHSGEIVLWDAARRVQIPVLTATTANVFEIVWHPNLPRFVVATSPSGLIIEQGTRTNLHILQWDVDKEWGGAYSEIQKLDCPASDINELTVMPNSLRHAFVTAACTDGRVYVWDTAQGDRPIHVLKHGYPIDDFTFDREREDTGIKFSAWGTTADRFYTGSSDGVVKVWNIRRKRHPFVRNLLEAPGPISCGVFSPDHAKLAVGDATGRVFLLSVDKRDAFDSHFTTLPGANHRVRRPQPFTPHPEPPPPPPPSSQSQSSSTASDASLSGHQSIAQYSNQTYIASRQLVLHKNPVIGAVQGPSYVATQLYRPEAHAHSDPQGPLLPEYERMQLETLAASIVHSRRCFRRLKQPAALAPEADLVHALNMSKDLDVTALPETLVRELTHSGAQLNLEGDEGWDFSYEEMPAWLEAMQLVEGAQP